MISTIYVFKSDTQDSKIALQVDVHDAIEIIAKLPNCSLLRNFLQISVNMKLKEWYSSNKFWKILILSFTARSDNSAAKARGRGIFPQNGAELHTVSDRSETAPFPPPQRVSIMSGKEWKNCGVIVVLLFYFAFGEENRRRI